MTDNAQPSRDLPEPPLTSSPERGADEAPWPSMNEESPTLSTDTTPADPEAGSPTDTGAGASS